MIDYGDAVSNFTYHRGFSHSLFVLPSFGVALWALLLKFSRTVREAPRAWFFAILLTLVTHPLLDAHTAYGTQLLWPMTLPPVSWSTVFIIDPVYTLPLLVCVLYAWSRPSLTAFRGTLAIGLAVSTLYLAWSWTAKLMVTDVIDETIADMGLRDAPVFTTPTPFNTLQWRVVVLNEKGYLEGNYSLVADNGNLRLVQHLFDRDLMAESEHLWAAQRLRWFARDFVSVRVIDDELVYTDLRMGQSPVYVFNHAVASRLKSRWSPIPGVQLPVSLEARQLGGVWSGIWEGNH